MLIARDHTEANSIELRQQACYWQAQHARAVKREVVHKDKIRHLEHTVRRQQSQIKELSRHIEALKAKLAFLQQQVFGRKSEQAAEHNASDTDDAQATSSTSEVSTTQKRNRGKQPGTKGFGRKLRTNLPSEDVFHDVAESDTWCPKCGAPRSLFPRTEDAEEIHWEVRLVRRVHKRKQYIATCTCDGVPLMVTAPPPAKLIPRGMFSIQFWVYLLIEKFLFQRPLYRIRKHLALHGLDVSQGTLTGGLKRLAALLHPLYPPLLERSRSATHWHMDETRWMVFIDIEGKSGHRWWLWVIVTHDTCIFVLDPSRSAKVPKHYLGDEAHGIVSADRYSAYKALRDTIRIAYCWSHVRRDFIRIHNGYPKLRSWADAWIARIKNLFHLNKKRLKARKAPSEVYQNGDQAVVDAIQDIAATRDDELANTALHQCQRKALKSLDDHWQGLTIFVDHPEVPMDNNEAERRLRNQVVGRKNYYGSGALWSGMLSAVVFSIFQTLLINHINPKRFLLAYFEACARNGGQAPENLDTFMPWNLPEAQKKEWYYPEKPP
jgi:transposase